MAGNKNRYSKSKKSKAAAEALAEEDFDRFAGSSDEEEDANSKSRKSKNSDGASDDQDDSGGDTNNNSGDEAVEMKAPKRNASKLFKKKDDAGDEEDEAAAADEEHHSDEEDDSDDEDDDDFDQYENQQRQKHGSAGMASAMSKILGTFLGGGDSSAASSPTSTHKTKKQKTSGSAVLSKTTTPLQRELQKEKEITKAMREKRREKAVNPLPALHIPLSVATSLTVGDGGSNKSVAQEMELERTHRRVATRGVVALFNAVAQHQKKGPAETGSTASSKSTEQVKKMTKHGFLDMIKTAAGGKTDSKTTKDNQEDMANNTGKQQKGAQTSKWAAMQDDYMLNPKKNWDQEDDSSEDDGPPGEMDLDGDEGGEAPASTGKKRPMVAA